jgi:uncharacterized repeat protein (TIGR01451 family)
MTTARLYRMMCLLFVWALAWAPPSYALTAAGTSISNQARLQFQVQNAPGEIQSNSVAFTVSQLLGVAVTSQDATDVGVNSPDLSRALTFRVTNVGNGTETYRLSRDDALQGDNFDPLIPTATLAALYIENGLQPGFQATGPNADTPYIAGSNDPILSAGSDRTVYVVSTIPAGQIYLDVARSRLIATSSQADVPGKLPGTSLPALSAMGSERVVGVSRGRADAIGAYRVTGVQTSIVKTVLKVLDPQGGTKIMPGAIITYRLVAEIRGKGTASSVTVSDPLPLQVRYKTGTLLLNGFLQTEAADSDPSNVDISTSPQILRVKLGNQTAPFVATVEFDTIVE